jgi:hypothetical protein
MKKIGFDVVEVPVFDLTTWPIRVEQALDELGLRDRTAVAAAENLISADAQSAGGIRPTRRTWIAVPPWAARPLGPFHSALGDSAPGSRRRVKCVEGMREVANAGKVGVTLGLEYLNRFRLLPEYSGRRGPIRQGG